MSFVSYLTLPFSSTSSLYVLLKVGLARSSKHKLGSTKYKEEIKKGSWAGRLDLRLIDRGYMIRFSFQQQRETNVCREKEREREQ